MVGRHQVVVRTCDRVRLIDGLAAERCTGADPVPLAVLWTVLLWWRALRWQMAVALAARRSA